MTAIGASTAVSSSMRAPRWPVSPVNGAQSIRGSFNDPRPTRPASYHFGVDILVNDDRPERGAPPGRTHRIYAVESGRVRVPPGNERASGDGKKLSVGHFSYWHADWEGVVKPGQYVKAGQMIGWTVKNEWHVHVSEWQMRNGKRVWVNPLRPGGKLGPLEDALPPAIHALKFYTPAPTVWDRVDGGKRLQARPGGRQLDPRRLYGKVDLRGWIGDRQPKVQWYARRPELHAELHPYRYSVEVRSQRTGKVVFSRRYVNDVLASGKGPTGWHYAPGTRQNLPAQRAIKLHGQRPGDNEYWFRLFSDGKRPYWDTRSVPNGVYTVTVTAADERGNSTRRRVRVRVANPSRQRPPE